MIRIWAGVICAAVSICRRFSPRTLCMAMMIRSIPWRFHLSGGAEPLVEPERRVVAFGLQAGLMRGTEFGLDDEYLTHAELRGRWQRRGFPWFSDDPPPPHWNPRRQLGLQRISLASDRVADSLVINLTNTATRIRTL